MKSLIPPGALDRHLAILGANGSGKTSAAKTGIVEPALTAGERVQIIDPTGVWWGLRIAADGKRKGFQIYVFGGDHGDYPLRARDAEMLAEAFGTSADSVVFDTSLMTVGERTAFFTEYAEAIRRKNRGPLKFIIDEAHLFMPQAGASFGGAAPAMLHAGNNLVSLGRSRGLRVTMISQRPAKLHKDSLTQAHSLVAMRLMAPQDRKAIAEWIADQADPERGKEIIASLPSMKPGEAWIWAPQDGVLDRVKFPLPKSYDSSKAPAIGDGDGPSLAPMDMDKLASRLKAVEADRKDNDPKALKAMIIRLQSDLAKASPIIPPLSEDERQTAYNQGFAAGAVETTRAYQVRLDMIKSLADRFCETIGRAMGPELELIQREQADRRHQQDKKMLDSMRQLRGGETKPHPTVKPPRPPAAPQRIDGDGLPLPKGEQACLIAVAQHPNGCTRPQLTVLTGYKRSTRDAYLQRLRERGHIEQNGDRIIGTELGVAALGSDYDPLPTGSALRDRVLRTLPEGERACLSVLINAAPNSVSRDSISDETGYKRSTRDAYLQRLATRELIETTPGAASASANLFD